MEPEKPSWWPEIAIIFVFIVFVVVAALMVLPPYQPTGFYTINRSLNTVNVGPTPTPGQAQPLSPTPTSGPVSMPVSTVTPVAPPAAIVKLGDFGILSQKPCGPPCAEG